MEDEQLMQGIDCVIHTATNYGRTGESASILLETNTLMPIKLFELAQRCGVNAFINTDTFWPPELSAYSLCKAFFLKLAEIQQEKNSTKFINVVLQHLYGPNDGEHKFIPYLIKTLIKNEPLDLTHGNQVRDFIYVEDAASAFVKIAQSCNKLENFCSIDLGSGVPMSIKDLVLTVKSITRSNSQLNFGAKSGNLNDPDFACADISKLKALGWTPEVQLLDGLKNLIVD